MEVRLGVSEGADEELVRRVDDAILQARPRACACATTFPAAAAAPGAPADGVTRPRSSRTSRAAGAPEPTSRSSAAAGGTDTVLPLRVEVLLRLVEPNLTAGRARGDRGDACATAVVAYVEALPMGAPLVHAKLLGRVVAPDEVADAEHARRPAHRRGRAAATTAPTWSPRAASSPSSPADVAVYLMDQRVRIDVRVRVEEQARRTASRRRRTPARGAAVEGGVDASGRLGARPDRARRGACRRRGGSRRGDLGSSSSSSDAIVRQRDATRRPAALLSDAAELALDEHEVPVLRRRSTVDEARSARWVRPTPSSTCCPRSTARASRQAARRGRRGRSRHRSRPRTAELFRIQRAHRLPVAPTRARHHRPGGGARPRARSTSRTCWPRTSTTTLRLDD